MNTAATLALALLIPVLAVPYRAMSGRFGILPALVPRRCRWWWRNKRFGLAPPRVKQRSQYISKRLRARVFRADRWRCVACEETYRDLLQVDHVDPPWIMGGLTVPWNLVTLCESCNSTKSCYWVSPSGHEYYRGRRKPPPRAALILAAERRARRNPWRWVLAFV